MILRGLLAIAAVGALCAAAAAEEPSYEHLRKHRAAGENPRYHVNRYGYGNYARGARGSYGGYPAGSGAARELEINQELRCRSAPESC